MKKILIILIILISHISGNIIEVDMTTSKEILSFSKIYVDNNKYNIEKIIEIDKKFIDINEPIKRYGYSPDFNVWIKFTLHNLLDILQSILES